ncbi:hypothetical protein CUMW_186850 [Citrus unshiu]|nr:hypothetical protein CUMW_186850 [Citrus unshiu]
MRKQLSELLNSKDFDDGQKIGSEKTLRRWRSACNGRRSFHKLAGLDEHLKLQEQVRVFYICFSKAVLHFTENLSLQSNEDVPSSEYIVTAAGTEARRFQEPIDDVGSTIGGLDEQVRVSPVVLKVVLHCTENLSLRSNEDVPSSEYVVTEAATEAGILQEPPVDDVGSTVNGLEICELLGKYKKRALAVFYLVLEAASFLLDIFGKSKRRILLAAFLLSAFGFAITMSTHSWTVRRNIAATRMHLQKRLLMLLEMSFSLVQLIVTLIYFILAELGVKNNFNTSVFPLVFAIIAAVFTFKYDGEVSESGLDSALVALAAGNQVHMPNITGNEDPEANGCMPMLADFR